ncbi:MAG: alanine-zipper protein [Gallionella sp.]
MKSILVKHIMTASPIIIMALSACTTPMSESDSAKIDGAYRAADEARIEAREARAAAERAATEAGRAAAAADSASARADRIFREGQNK